MHKPRVLLVEDEAGIAQVIEYTLGSEGFDCHCAATAAQALSAFAACLPDLVILDIGLPDMSGFELFRRLHQQAPGIPLLFLTARSEEIDRVAGLELGADDYIAKPFSPRELAARVRAVLRRSQRPPAAAPASAAPAQVGETAAGPWHTLHTAAGPLAIQREQRLIRYHGQRLALSRHEYGLLAALMQRPGRVCSRAELLEAVWGQDCESYDRTVDTHIKTLRAKLRAAAQAAQVEPSQTDPIRTERGLGYALHMPE